MILLATMMALLAHGEPEGVIATAPAGDGAPPVASLADVQTLESKTERQAHGLTTQQQIDRWLFASAAQPSSDGELGGTGQMSGELGDAPERRVRGEVSAAIGTGGYRAWSASMNAPLGEDGFISLFFSESEGGPGYGYGYDDGIDPPLPLGPRQRR